MARLCLRVSFGLKRERRFDLEPSSTKRQMASGLEGLGIGCSLIHPSTEASSDRGSRRPILRRAFALAAFVQRRSPALLLLLPIIFTATNYFFSSATPCSGPTRAIMDANPMPQADREHSTPATNRGYIPKTLCGCRVAPQILDARSRHCRRWHHPGAGRAAA
jgi:hypothetical protein